MNSIRPDMANHPMAQAAREVNAYVETHSIEDACEHYGLKVEDIVYMAEQRALRAVFATKGINLNSTETQVLSLSPTEQGLLQLFMPAYMDGLIIGWRAKEIEDSTDHTMKGEQ